ncbi:2OG-Fe dioxygenase family protein [Cysteiniphilum sp. QT6929]|uniref:2OG-Fe dioxygenase family protein n=1 Tax=Cysteiniphilum sp. QT6929 TaxID=2975055 RepID=UPI0024B3B632|nr:2OG-Fe dioxygenase family protein [Cysteiniphilum sp. QT6929]WHN65191.1 2OG-Fe dioxygenase family protein [Cysteiniphilum sp. QT6929]
MYQVELDMPKGSNRKAEEAEKAEEMMYQIAFIGDLKPIFAKSFETLKRDPNMRSGDNYRHRAFAVGDILRGEISVSPHSEVFHQSKKLNKYQGGIDRSFPLIEMDIAKKVASDIIMAHIYPRLPACDYHFGIHQIRIYTNDEVTGKPAPEGVHQDGFDYVTVVCVDMQNITGGNSLLVDINKHQHIHVNQALKEGEMFLFNDRKYAHYASPIVPLLPGAGHRDVFVITMQIKK